MSLLDNLGQGLSSGLNSLYNYVSGSNPPAPNANNAASADHAAASAQVPPQPVPSAPELSDSDSDDDDVAPNGSNPFADAEKMGKDLDKASEQLKNQKSNPVQLEKIGKKLQSIAHALKLLEVEKIKMCDDKVNRERAKFQELQDQSKLFNRIVEKINIQRNAQGELDVTNDPEMLQLFTNAKNLGLQVPQKDGKHETQFNKDQVDSFIRAIDARQKTLDTDMRLQMNAIEDVIKFRDKIIELIKDIWEKYKRAVDAFLAAIAQIGRKG